MRKLLVMIAADLRQQVLDKSFFIFGLAVPFALMAVFNLVFAPLTEDLEPITVAVSVPDGDQLGAVVPQVLSGLDGGGMPVTVQQVDAADATSRVEEGEAGVGVVVPEGFTAGLMAGRAPEVTVRHADGTGLEADVVTGVVDGLMTQFTSGARTLAAAQALGADPAQLGQLAQEVSAGGSAVAWTPGESADEQLSPQGTIVAGQAGFFLLFTVGFGVLGLVVEREWGTLARLLSMPMPSWLVVLSKGLSSFVLGVVATAVLLTAGSLFFDVDFGSPLAVAVLLLAVVAAATSIMFLIAKVARTAEQAGVAQAIVAITLGMAGGAFFQVGGSGMLSEIMQVNPVAAMSRGLGVTSGGGGVVDLGPVLLTMLIFTAAMLTLSWLLPGRKDAL
ncbi:ABC transporter permease [Serinicoccus kebangsaanensis]|uniref:ABC transporter permease n=1 Tax=Serinicoccus kebangsaanensis TaxID=2602069 RepID=UPI00124EC9D7|nr:ABC transporter permease [Serinicoccus kebangsaanensis]